MKILLFQLFRLSTRQMRKKIAKMLAGENVTEAALSQARELFKEIG